MAGCVLAVKDDSTMARVLSAYLDNAGFGVEWTIDGAEPVYLWQWLSSGQSLR